MSLLLILATLAVAPGDCQSLEPIDKLISAHHGKFKPLSEDQLYFARGMYTATPPVSPWPAGFEADIAVLPQGMPWFNGTVLPKGSAIVVFMSGKCVTGQMPLAPDVADTIIDIDKTL